MVSLILGHFPAKLWIWKETRARKPSAVRNSRKVLRKEENPRLIFQPSSFWARGRMTKDRMMAVTKGIRKPLALNNPRNRKKRNTTTRVE